MPIIALFNSKIKRRYLVLKQHHQYRNIAKSNNTSIWFHCASLGEFEMARPFIDELKLEYKNEISIYLSFFSPSGFEIRQNYKNADYVFYLPIDTLKNSKAIVNQINPDVFVLVKYEIWPNLINALVKNKTKLMIINGLFSKEKSNSFYAKLILMPALKKFDYIYVQNSISNSYLKNLGISSTVTGDIRFERTLEAQKQIEHSFSSIKNNDKITIVAGSTWPNEEQILYEYVKLHSEIQLIIAPHDISKTNINRIQTLFNHSAKMMRENNFDSSSDLIIVDTIGHLFTWYQIADIAIVGGGFSGKLHNIIEPASYGIPVFFGKNHSRFPEAQYFIENQVAFTFDSFDELRNGIKMALMHKPDIKQKLNSIFQNQLGTKSLILNQIKQIINANK